MRYPLGYTAMFNPHWGQLVVPLSKIHLVLVDTLEVDMTEKLLTGTLNLNTNKQISDLSRRLSEQRQCKFQGILLHGCSIIINELP